MPYEKIPPIDIEKGKKELEIQEKAEKELSDFLQANVTPEQAEAALEAARKQADLGKGANV